jgi:hypothetical protein
MAEARSKLSCRPGFLAVGLALAALVAPMPHAHAAPACTGRYTVSAGTVTDNDTHLVWQQDVDLPGVMQCNSSSGIACYTWQGALDYCHNLPLAGGGWRLPTIFELQTIVDESKVQSPSAKFDSAIDPVAFPNTPLDVYWSSSSFAGGPGSAWCMDSSNGFTSLRTLSFDPANRVRCVR